MPFYVAMVVEGGGGLTVTFYHFKEPKYLLFRRRSCYYMIIYVEYLFYQVQFDHVLIQVKQNLSLNIEISLHTDWDKADD